MVSLLSLVSKRLPGSGAAFSLSLMLLLAACGSDDGPGSGGGGGGGGGSGSGGSSSPVLTVTIPDTGQTSCYYDYIDDGIYIPSEFTCLSGSAWGPDGQDGNYSINPMSFTDNANGTVLDNVTGLTWQKCTLGDSGADCSAGTRVSATWDAAKTACTNLNLAGTGWRLPTVSELTQIVNYGESLGTIDSTVFPGGTVSSYWSSTAHANVTNWAWYVSFSQGNAGAFNKTETYYVRCVRT